MKEYEDPEQEFGETPYVTSTRGVKIMVWPELDRENSEPESSVFLYEYFIKIVNESTQTLQLVSRHWKIVDGMNRVEDVKGQGVIGMQPVLSPGESFTYSSYCPLRTPSGSMSGTFQMKDKNQSVFDAEIGEFYLRDQMMIN